MDREDKVVLAAMLVLPALIARGPHTDKMVTACEAIDWARALIGCACGEEVARVREPG